MTRRNLRRLRIFAAVQVAASFILLTGTGMLMRTLFALNGVDAGLDTRHVLSVNLPVNSYGRTPDQVVAFSKEAIRRVHELPGVKAVAIGSLTPWREYFAALGVSILAGRDFSEIDRQGGEPVVIVSRSAAERMFPGREALGRNLTWTDPYAKFIGMTQAPQRIIGIAGDIDDENLIPAAPMTIYTPLGQGPLWGGRLFVHASSDPYALVTPITRAIRNLSADQPVERAATLADVRAEVLTPDRLNVVIFGGFAGVALLIAVVGVAGVLAFSVSGRTREFCYPAGGRFATAAGADTGNRGGQRDGVCRHRSGSGVRLGPAATACRSGGTCRTTGCLVVLVAAAVLLSAAVIASAVPAARAARVDLIRALRAE